MTTATELEPFLDQKKGGGVHIYESEAWESITEWAKVKRMATGKSLKERARKDFKEKAAYSRMSKYWKGSTDLGSQYVATLLDQGLELRDRLKGATSLKGASQEAGVRW